MLQGLFSLAIFSSAFLLFFVQPMLAKYMTPQFGGSSFVWITSLLFFQAALLLGYAYAYLLTKFFSEKKQAIIHCVMLLLSLFYIPIKMPPMIVGDMWPPLAVLQMLNSSILLPFIILSASSPLLQHWYYSLNKTTYPYVYYSISNAGSLLGLIGYPFLLEPFIGLNKQSILCSVLYVAYALLCALCLLRVFLLKTTMAQVDVKSPKVKYAVLLRWLGLSFLTSALLLSTTQFLTQNVINAPMVWILPLALYLISFISTFAMPKGYEREFWIPIFCVFLIVILKNIFFLTLNGLQLVILFLGLLYSSCIICHGELIRLKPESAKLTLFYLMIALGSVLGGCFANGLSLLFATWLNLYLPIFTINVMIIIISYVLYNNIKTKKALAIKYFSLLTIIALIIVLLYGEYTSSDRKLILQQRNLYGLLRIYDAKTTTGSWQRVLMHGTVMHGFEFLEPEKQLLPTSYYLPNGGAGLAIQFMHQNSTRPLQIAVVGLGIGTIAALTKTNDNITFYEIDPAVKDIAYQYFNYLKLSPAKSQVILGDARLELAKMLKSNKFTPYDVIIIDAFNGDAIPFHLITQEAFTLYQSLLNPQGIIVFHTSNYFIDLKPITAGLAFDKQCEHFWIESLRSNRLFSTWGMISCNPNLGSWLKNQPEIIIIPNETIKPILWTDDDNSLLPIFKLQ